MQGDKAQRGYAPWSLRNRMLAITMGVTVLAWLVGGFATVQGAREVSSRQRDARLVQLAHAIGSFVDHELAEIAADPARAVGAAAQVHVETVSTLDHRYSYQIWSADGRLLLRSHGAPSTAAIGTPNQLGLGYAMVAGEWSRTYVVKPRVGGVAVHVADCEDDELALFELLGPSYALALLLSMLAAVGLAAWLVVRGLRPIALAQSELQARRSDDLTPVQLPDAPREMQPLLARINTLLMAAQQRLAQETGFTALAAHELRTPLAALRMQAQVALREADAPARERMLLAIVASVDRCDHMVEQLLALARVEHGATATDSQVLALDLLCETVAADMAPALLQCGMNLQLDLRLDSKAQTVRGHAFAVELLLRNVLRNAMSYAGGSGLLKVSTRHEAGAVVLAIEDSGPGIAEHDIERVLQRFVRLAQAPQVGSARVAGVGLGLAIVQSVAALHGGDVQLGRSPALGGLRVEVRLPQLP